MMLCSVHASKASVVALSFVVGGLVGCNSDATVTSAPPASSALPVPSKADLGSNGKPNRSSASFDSARGGSAPQ